MTAAAGAPAAAAIVAADLAAYPPRARRLATDHLAMLNRLPPFFAAILLREAMEFDFQFPPEQDAITAQFAMLRAPWSPQLAGILQGFATPAQAAELNGVSPAADPAGYSEKATAALWLSGGIEAFRKAALAYGALLPVTPAPPGGRLVVVLLGRGTTPAQQGGLFGKLRQQGTLFRAVDSSACLAQALAAVAARARATPAPYAHWYLEGDTPAVGAAPALTTVSYGGTAALRTALLERIHTARVSGTVGPENLRSLLTHLRPQQLSTPAAGQDPVLGQYELRLLTEGSGTQVYSTTFVQWGAREALRRAQPQTLLARFAPRQAERPMNDLLLASDAPLAEDAEGALRDADMGAWYTWLNLARLPGAEQSRFVAVVEGGHSAVAVAPGLARGAESTQSCDLNQILRWLA